jgi:cold shock CspA family protein
LSTIAAISLSKTYHRHIGKVYSWKPTGFGFISEPDVEADIFFQIRDVLDSSIEDVPEGTYVEYDITEGTKGPRAVNIVILQ